MLNRDKKRFYDTLNDIANQLDTTTYTLVDNGQLSSDGKKNFDEIVLGIHQSKKEIQSVQSSDSIVHPQFDLLKNGTVADIGNKIYDKLEVVNELSATISKFWDVVDTIKPAPVREGEDVAEVLNDCKYACRYTQERANRAYRVYREKLAEDSTAEIDDYNPIRNLCNYSFSYLWGNVRKLEAGTPQDPNDYVSILRVLVTALNHEANHIRALLIEFNKRGKEENA